MNALALPRIPGFDVKLWAKVPGRERVYLTCLRKSNGGERWNGGIGRADYLDLSSMRWHEVTGWAGAATRDRFSAAVASAKAEVVAAVKAASVAA